jgi:hypothetical protein
LKYLNVNCQLKEGLFCKIELGFLSRKRGRAEGGSKQQAAENKHKFSLQSLEVFVQ